MIGGRKPEASFLAISLLVGAGIALAAASDSDLAADPWEALRPLVGVWKGEGSGFGGPSHVTHEWRFVLGEQFLRLRTQSTSTPVGEPSDVHEDIGFISRDKDTGSYVFRQFFSEGFVNTYDLKLQAGENPKIVFDCRETESAGGMRARLRMNFLSDGEYEMLLDLAAPGKDYAACQAMLMKKIE